MNFSHLKEGIAECPGGRVEGYLLLLFENLPYCYNLKDKIWSIEIHKLEVIHNYSHQQLFQIRKMSDPPQGLDIL